MSDENVSRGSFSWLAQGADADFRVSQSTRQFAHRLTLFTLKRLGLSAIIKVLTRRARDETGLASLTFPLFNDTFPDFPMYLDCHDLRLLELPDGQRTPESYAVHMDKQATEVMRFIDFERVPFVVAYRRLRRMVPKEVCRKPIGLIFPRRGFSSGMIIHNDEGEQGWVKGTCWVYKGKNERLYVQPYGSYLEAVRQLDRSWANNLEALHDGETRIDSGGEAELSIGGDDPGFEESQSGGF